MTLDQFLKLPGSPTAAEFGAKVGISEATISRIRKGLQNITSDVMLAIIAESGGLVTADGLLSKRQEAA